MAKRDYPDLPLGEISPEESKDAVSDDVSIEGYTGKSLDEIIERNPPSPPAEKLEAEWVPRSQLVPNDWNPNFMPDHRKDLLVLSILDNGWTAPILVDDEDTIIDGEHRWQLAEHPWLSEWDDRKPEGANSLTPEGVPQDHVPVHRVEDMDRKHQMIATYQQNYATGNDDANKLGELVESLDEDEQRFTADRMGVTQTELELLLPEDSDISDDATELWDVPWDEETDSGSFTDRMAFDMLETEAGLIRHIFGGEQTAEPMLKLARFIVETELYEEVEGVPEPSLGVFEEDEEVTDDE